MDIKVGESKETMDTMYFDRMVRKDATTKMATNSEEKDCADSK